MKVVGEIIDLSLLSETGMLIFYYRGCDTVSQKDDEDIGVKSTELIT